MKARKIRVIVAGFVAVMAITAAAPVMADELTCTPAVYAMSSTRTDDHQWSGIYPGNRLQHGPVLFRL